MLTTTIRRSGDDLYITIPEKVLSDLGWDVDQEVQVSVDDRTIRLGQVTQEKPDSNLEALGLAVHEETLNLFEGDRGAKERWMASPVHGLGNRTPNEMLRSATDIETVRLLVARLEHGSMP
jgi:uncharacterized protein (DUF2384 family)